MSFMDRRRRAKVRGVPGLEPPRATPLTLWRDLLWHWRVYRMDGLPLTTRLAFLVLRVVQRLAYNRGWRRGGSP